jgi:hypothetical protein
MTKKAVYRVSILAMIMITTALVCHGRVFLRWGSAAQSARTMESLGGKIAYTAAININGGKGQLTVFGFNEPIAAVVSSVTRAFDISGFAYRGGSMGYGSVSTNGQTLRFVVIRIESQVQTLVFQIEQTDEENRRSSLPPEGQMLTVVPSYPDSLPLFFASDENAGMSMAISRTSSDMASVQQSMEQALIGAGWEHASLEPREKDVRSDMKVYIKQQEICCILVIPSETTGENRITVLHKQRGMK